MQIRRVLGLGVALALLVTAGPALAQRNNNRQQQPQPQQRMPADPDTIALVRLVDGVATGGQPAPADIAVTWETNHFVKGQGGITYIPFTLAVDRAALAGSNGAAAVYIRAVNKNQPAAPAAPAPAPAAPAQGNNNRNNRNQPAAAPVVAAPVYAWDNIHFLTIPADGKLSRAIALQPGEYDLFIGVKERAAAPADPKAAAAASAAAAAAPPAGKMTLVRRDLSVPNFNAPELQTSSIILASAVEPITAQLSPAEQEANPYVFGPMRIVPAMNGRFSKSAELQVIFWIYGASEAPGGKPDVTVEFNFHQKQADGTDKYFNKTEPQALNAQTLPPEFSVAAGHQLPGSLVVGLVPFPVGDYRLEIKVTDKPTGKVVTQNVNFTVVPV
jgi:hypothetical protein